MSFLNASQLLDIWWLSLCVWREARGESIYGKGLVASVIINRSRDKRKRWPNTIQGVIRQRLQFSSFNPTDPNSNLYPIETDVSWIESVDAAINALNTTTQVTKANHYHTTATNPPWANPAKATEIEGHHKFYQL